jgi:hypothetical protein
MGEGSSSGQSSLGATLGAGAGTAWRKLRGRPGRNQTWLRGVRAGVSGFAGPLKHVLQVLFLELSGVVFLFFAVGIIISPAFVREYRQYRLHEVGPERLALAAGIALMFLYFGVSSFWRARRRRSKA